MTPDNINGIFEVLGCSFILPSVVKLHREKMVRGVSWLHALFFWSWGVWNMFYYPSLDQWWSFAGGVALFSANTVWVGQLIYYRRK